MPWDEALVDSIAKTQELTETGRLLTYSEALNEALFLSLSQDENVFVLGQGIDDPSACFGVTKNLKKQFGSERVFDTPLSEEGMTGICVGAALSGMRPVYFHNRPDFLLLAFNQIVNHASKYHYMDNGLSSVPLVIWSAIGRGWGSGAQHSQAIQGLLIGVPGLKIVMPSTPFDAKGLMLTAIKDNNPVLIFEHRWLMKNKGHVPKGYYEVPLGKGIYRRHGEQLTIVGSSQALDIALKATDEVSKDGISADVIDLRSIKPLDEEIILQSLHNTGRLLIVDTGWAMGGVCAEIAAIAAEKGYPSLKAPVRRIGLPDVPTPAGFTLEQAYYPDVNKVISAIKEMCALPV